MKIRKAFQGTVPENKILDTYSTSQTDTYSCNYINSNGGVTITALWTGSNNTIGASLPLNDSVENYDFILLTAHMFAHSTTLIPVGEIEYGTANNIVWNVGPVESGSVYSVASISFSNSTTAYIQNIHNAAWGPCNVTGIYGIKL